LKSFGKFWEVPTDWFKESALDGNPTRIITIDQEDSYLKNLN